MADKNRAKRIILEIIRQSGGIVEGRTCLFKTFYFAHLYYAKSAADYLSDWPIARMPNGPGIHDADVLIKELIAEGAIEERRAPVGPYFRVEYRDAGKEIPISLSEEAICAITEAVEFTADKTAAELSELTHEYSRSWKSARDGEELNIYIDLLTEEEYEEGNKKIDHLASALGSVWN